MILDISHSNHFFLHTKNIFNCHLAKFQEIPIIRSVSNLCRQFYLARYKVQKSHVADIATTTKPKLIWTDCK